MSQNASLTVLRSTPEIESLRRVWCAWPGHRDVDIDVYLTTLHASSERAQPFVVFLRRNDLPEALLVAKISSILHPRTSCIFSGFGRRSSDEFDLRFGVNTGSIEPISSDIKSDNWVFGVCYQPTPAHVFQEVLGKLPIRHEDFIFIDFGSGKGRILLMACEFPFKAVVGIEFSPRLHHLAEQNITNFMRQAGKCKSVTSICMDAAFYSIPLEQLVRYFYNPFAEPVMAAVLRNLEESLLKTPREVFILYYNPVCGFLLDGSTLFKRIISGLDYSVYESTLSTARGEYFNSN